MDQQPRTPDNEGSENQPEWFSRVNNESSSEPIIENIPSKPKRNRVVPIVAALAIVGAATAYGVNRTTSDSNAIDDTLVSGSTNSQNNSQGNSQGDSNLPTPTITGGPQSGPGGHPEGEDPDGDNWTGANRHHGPFDPNQPRPHHGEGDDDGFGEDD